MMSRFRCSVAAVIYLYTLVFRTSEKSEKGVYHREEFMQSYLRGYCLT